MTYSSSNFNDDVLGELVRVGVVSENVPDDDPETQAQLAIAGIGKLVQARDALASYRSAVHKLLERRGVVPDAVFNAADEKTGELLDDEQRVAPRKKRRG